MVRDCIKRNKFLKYRHAQTFFNDAFHERRGISVIEVIIGTAILVGVFIVVGSIAQYALNLTNASNGRIRSSFLATEGVEAVKTMRDRGYSAAIAALTPDTTYYLVFSSGQWDATTTATVIDGKFTRTFVMQDVSRNALDRIVSSGGTNDPDTKKITITVAWAERGVSRQDSISTYLTNLFKN